MTLACPERLSGKRDVDHAKSDMWSLGCVFSEAATWAILGRTGVRQYTMIRQAASKTSHSSRVKNTDCFHDGEKVLAEVFQWHKLLRQIKRPTDYITELILDMVDRQLFVEVKDRSDANKICQWWKEHEPFTPSVLISIPKTIQDVLEHEIEQEALEVSQQFQSLGNDNMETRRAAKSSNVFLQLPGMNRTTVYATTSRRPSQVEPILSKLYHTESPDSQRQPSIQDNNNNADEVRHWSPRHSNPMLEPNHGSTWTPTKQEKVTIFDAYYDHLPDNSAPRGPLTLFRPSTIERKEERLIRGLVDRDLV
jgi:serine/threonine protein kinase